MHLGVSGKKMLDLNLKVEAIIKAIGVLPIKSALLMADVVIGVLLFVPERVLQLLYISEIVRMHRQCLGLSFLVVTACLVVMCIHSVIQWIRIRKMYTGNDARKRLGKLSSWAKAMVRQMYESAEHAQKLPLQNGNVAMMLAGGVIGHAQLGDAIGFECYLQPWVVDFLDQNPEFLESLSKFDKPYNVSAGLW